MRSTLSCASVCATVSTSSLISSVFSEALLSLVTSPVTVSSFEAPTVAVFVSLTISVASVSAVTVVVIAVGSLASATKKAFPNVENTIRNAVAKDKSPLVARFITYFSLQQNFIFIWSPPNKVASRRIVPI